MGRLAQPNSSPKRRFWVFFLAAPQKEALATLTLRLLTRSLPPGTAFLGGAVLSSASLRMNT